MLISVEETINISYSQFRKVKGMPHCCHIVLCWEILDRNRPVCWSIVVKEKPTDGSQFFEAFPSDPIPKLTMHIGANLWDRNFPHATIPVNYTSEFRELLKLIRICSTPSCVGLILFALLCQWYKFASLISWYSVDNRCTSRPNKKSTVSSEN
jgi:hypothetical protein